MQHANYLRISGLLFAVVFGAVSIALVNQVLNVISNFGGVIK